MSIQDVCADIDKYCFKMYVPTLTSTATLVQVSNQSMALVRDDILVPTKDAPELAYIRHGELMSSEKRFTI